MKKIIISLVILVLIGCSKEDRVQSIDATQANAIQGDLAQKHINQSTFTLIEARKNLRFAKNQYLKMIDNVNNKRDLHALPICSNDGVLCFPRAEIDGQIHMEQPRRWTNGFYQGVLWKLLASKDYINDFTAEQEKRMFEHATLYQDAILKEATRKDTHDLGFLLFDSFGEALGYAGLSKEQHALYTNTLKVGRESLATRFNKDKGVIRSWSWQPRFVTQYRQDGEIKKGVFDLRHPWTYPVIIDNMMNLEFLLSGDNLHYQHIAYEHALSTYKNHYFYARTDKQKQYPIAYHVFDYGEMKPGNWQGMGNISAWARGQGWSLYGFVSVAEAAKKSSLDTSQNMNYNLFTQTLFESVKHLMRNDPVPDWDFYAVRDDAYSIASNVSNDTAVYSHILDLCDYQIDKNILPYKNWGPIEYDAQLLSDESLALLKRVSSVNGEPFIEDGKISPCGKKPFELNARVIPKDTSAAALIASAVYRLAQFTDDQVKKQKYIEFADAIMAELTQKYLTAQTKDKSYDLGFIMEDATGNLPNSGEISVPIVYADFYFVEANIRKIALEKNP